MEIKVDIKGRILKGDYANGEILVKKNNSSKNTYKIFIWPKDGSKWPNTDKEMVYDYWVEDFCGVENIFKESDWQIEWLE